MILSRCQNGHIFPSGIQFRGGKGVVRNNSEPCRMCGASANTIDGTYQIGLDGITTLMEGSSFDKDVVRKFHALVSDVKNGTKTADQLVEETQKLHPGLANLLKELFSAGTAKDLIVGALLLILANFLSKDKASVVYNTTNVTVYESPEVDVAIIKDISSNKSSNARKHKGRRKKTKRRK